MKAKNSTYRECTLMRLLYHEIHWSFCKWDVCYQCLLDGTVFNLPALGNARMFIDVNVFTKIKGDLEGIFHHRSEYHGEQFAPELVADFTNIFFANGCSIETEFVDFKSLPVELHVEKALKRDESNFMFLPNARGYHSTVTYNVVKRFSVRNGNMVYLLIKARKEYESLPRFEKCLQGQHVQHSVWTSYACITGTL